MPEHNPMDTADAFRLRREVSVPNQPVLREFNSFSLSRSRLNLVLLKTDFVFKRFLHANLACIAYST
jgi:hypothetical protein